MVIQLVSAGPVATAMGIQGKKFDFAEFVTETLDMMGWSVENLITDMTPEDLKRQQESNAAFTRVQGDQQLEQAKHSNDLENIDAKGSAQAGVAVVRSILKNHEVGRPRPSCKT